MKTIHQIAEAAYAAYAKSITRSGVAPRPWDDLTPAQHTAWYEATRCALAEAAIAPIPMPTENVDVEHSIDTSETDARPFPSWGAP